MAANRVNRNESPLRKLSDLNQEIRWSIYDRASLFTHLCTLAPNNDNERLDVREIHDPDLWGRRGLVYAMVVEDRIFKIGQSINTFKDRLGSYNSGRMSFRSRGTNSSSNFFALQTFLQLGHPVEIYALFPDHKTWRFLGETGREAFPSSKVAERIVLGMFRESYDRLPLGCGQS